MSARVRCDLGFTTCHQHYVLIGNEGVGKSDAVEEIYQRMKCFAQIANCETHDAVSMFETNEGFGTTLFEACKDNTVIYIKNAERLAMKGNANPKSGIEELCNAMSNMKNSGNM